MVTALGAAVLNIKPCIEVKDGKMIVAKKYRGSLEKCIKRYVIERLENREDIINGRIFITDSGISEEIRKTTEDLVKEYGSFNEILKTRAGCTVSSHCGENTLGVLFIRK